MILTFEVTPEEAQRLEHARTQGFDVNALLRGMIASLPPVPATEQEKSSPSR